MSCQPERTNGPICQLAVDGLSIAAAALPGPFP